MENNNKYEIFHKHGFHNARLIAGSKSLYRRRFPNHDVMFNANIITKEGKIFYGDIDLDRDNLPLQRICNEIGEEFIVVSEMLGRFGAEERSYEELEKDAHAKFIPNKRQYLVKKYDGIYGVKINKMTIVTGKSVGWRKVRIKKWSQSRGRKI